MLAGLLGVLEPDGFDVEVPFPEGLLFWELLEELLVLGLLLPVVELPEEVCSVGLGTYFVIDIEEILLLVTVAVTL